MRIISSLWLIAAAMTLALACDKTSSSRTPTGPSVGATVASLSIIGERQMAIGQVVTLRAVAFLSDGSTRDVSNQVAWQSSNAIVCSADRGGLVVAAGVGICDVSAVLNSVITTASFAVVDQTWTGDIVSFEVLGPRSLAVGQGDRYIVMANVPDGSQADVTARATFSSSNLEVADVDSDGRVVALADGSTTITVTAAGIQVAFRLYVEPSPVPRSVS